MHSITVVVLGFLATSSFGAVPKAPIDRSESNLLETLKKMKAIQERSNSQSGIHDNSLFKRSSNVFCQGGVCVVGPAGNPAFGDGYCQAEQCSSCLPLVQGLGVCI